MSGAKQVPPGVDPTRPSPARMYDRYLGGTANDAADREAADQILALVPEIRDAAWANRGFLLRAVHWMAEQGIRQFLDLGAGLPAQQPTHEAARRIAPDARVLYTDSDPGVIAHGRHLLAGVPGVELIQADFRQPDELLNHPAARRLIDFSQPVGLLIVAVTHFIADADDPWSLVARYVDALAPGSYLALSAATPTRFRPASAGRVQAIYASSTIPVAVARGRDEIARFFAGLEMVRPYPGAGLVPVPVGMWDCEDPAAADSDGSRMSLAAVARKPGDGGLVKPTVADLGLDVGALDWQRSPGGPGGIEVTFAPAAGQDWVLLRVGGDPSGRVSVFSRFEWDCFLDGVRNDEFDDGT